LALIDVSTSAPTMPAIVALLALVLAAGVPCRSLPAATYLPTAECTAALGNVTMAKGGAVVWPDRGLQARCGHQVLTKREIKPLFRDKMVLFLGNSVLRHLSETLELEIGVGQMEAPLARSAPAEQAMEKSINTGAAFSGGRREMHAAYVRCSLAAAQGDA